jgi:hypothetical protein
MEEEFKFFLLIAGPAPINFEKMLADPWGFGCGQALPLSRPPSQDGCRPYGWVTVSPPLSLPPLQEGGSPPMAGPPSALPRPPEQAAEIHWRSQTPSDPPLAAFYERDSLMRVRGCSHVSCA